jgi:hypothetical protein
LFLFSFISVSGQKDQIYESFFNGFKSPPGTARPNVYYWWLGGNVDTVILKQEIASMKQAGIAGFTIFEIGTPDTAFIKSGPPFLEKESLDAIRIAITEADKYGMEVGLNTASSWNAGGTWITPEHAAKSIYCSSLKVKGEKVSERLPFPEIPELDPWGKPRQIKFRPGGKPVFYKEIAVLAVPAKTGNILTDTSEIRIVTDYFDAQSEILRWDSPPGEWEILRYVCSNSGENLVIPSVNSAGPIVDHYDAAATEFHFSYIIDKLKSVLGDFEGTALKNLYMASYEAKGFTWTVTLPEIFWKINGYKVEKFLPALFDKNYFSPDVQKSFIADFQRTLSELMINNFYRKSKEICNKYGLKNNSEAGGPGLPLHNVPVEPIKALGSLDLPRGEFWINHNHFNERGVDVLRVVKEVSAASHIYNRGIVEMEAFTTFQHWQEGPFEMKPSGDRAFCEGMNKAIIHGFTHNPEGTGFPGIVYGAGTHFNSKQTWWNKIKPFNEYLGRISFILQEADFVADVLYYYGDTIPNYGGHKNSRFTAGPGYDYEIINTEKLLELTVKDGKILLPGTGARFSLLALTNEYEINPEVLTKLKDLAASGAIIAGPRPLRNPDLPDAKGLIGKLWTDIPDALPGKNGRIYEKITPQELLQKINIVPDFNYPDKDLYTIDYIHYTKSDLDFYLLRNTTGEWISRNCSFRQMNKSPEIWDPVTGNIIMAPVFKYNQQYTTLPVTLAPYGSLIIVFRNSSSGSAYSHIEGNGNPPLLQYTDKGICFLEDGIIELKKENEVTVIENYTQSQFLEGAWELFFPEGWGAPKRIIFPELVSWTKCNDEGIRYFSGTAIYKKSFQYDINSNAWEDQVLFLDLGNLRNVGEVWLNNQPLGIIWAKPYRFDISRILRADNELVIEITNTWSNRLKGDAVNKEKYTNTNITSTNINGLNKIATPWAEVPLIESGLLGPVRLMIIKPVR